MKTLKILGDLFWLLLDRAVNPLYLLILAGVTFGFQLLFGHLSWYIHAHANQDAYVNIATMVATALLIIYVLYLGPKDKESERAANVFKLLVAIAVAMVILWFKFLDIVTTPIWVEFKDSLDYVLSSIFGILIAELMVYIAKKTITKLFPKLWKPKPPQLHG